MESIISKGNTVDEAIRAGLKELNAAREEVSVEIIQAEKKRLFGIVSRPAIVKITKIKQMQSVTKEIEETDSLEGKVWLKDGKLFYRCSSSQRPTITVGKGVKLFKNGEEVNGTIELEENDELQISVEEDEKIDAKWNVTMDKRKIQAVLTIEPAVRRRYVLKDIPPTRHMHLQAHLETEVEHDVQYEQIIEKLKELHIVYGIKESNIMEALQATEKTSVVIAEGIEPVEGKDGWVELKVGNENARRPKLREDGTVDFREMEMITNVSDGQLVAVVHPPQPGVPGITVTNEVIPFRETHPVTVQLGKGVAMSEDGTEIVAVQSGRPEIIEKGRTVIVSIIPKFVHQGDVDLSTGNIRFKGDIEITGNVQDEMEVEALGNVVIFQNVNRAKIQAQQSIFIHRNLISGTVISGENKIVLSELALLLDEIKQKLERMILAIRQMIMSSKVQDKDIYFLIRRMLDTKFHSLFETMKQYQNICRNKREHISEQWIEMGNKLQSYFFAEKPNHFHSYKGLENLLRELNIFISQHEQHESDLIELSYAMNSVIRCSGDVIVFGKGCYNCNIYAGGELKVNGVLRGGEAFARKGIKVREVGSSMGVTTLLAVPKGETIQMDRVWEGTVIQIGKKKYTFYEEKRLIEAKWDNEKDDIIFNSTSI
ncbi:FapA family protein [Thermolongibacillus altinsuensis]|uniref:FapA family protein n=1 Tax=Thermolongibacillus altinsuensis TaxID=575256 RepID=UPI00242A2CB2|nr:FapA family protein [Thermolongibacillus altinsuensis]GMB07989.1 hypothetical protein B1no1_06990 [Thermolongibacillus altinsuensis]